MDEEGCSELGLGALDGIRVLDMSQAVSGPHCGRILADLGADVVKVEWARGDVANLFGEKRSGISSLYVQMNAGKRGVSIDRDATGGVALVLDLAAAADVVIENFRPGVLHRAGLSFEVIADRNPGVVMLSITGFGQVGPEAHRRAFAPVIHAESGLLGRQASFDGGPPRDIGLSLGDSVASLHGAIAVLAALRSRDVTGRGQHVDLAMLDALVASDDYTHYAIDGREDVSPHGGVTYAAIGGPIMIGADVRTTWRRLVDYARLADPDPSVAPADRFAARRLLIEQWVASFNDRTALIDALEDAGLAWANIRTSSTLFDSPTLQHRDVIAWPDDHTGRPRGVVRMPYRFSGSRAEVRRGAPGVGQHNLEVLREWLGHDEDRLRELRSSGALKTGGPDVD